ncbi:MAG: adenylate/guanylate cyclase domain-containing protein [Azonexus sp.]
MGLKADLTTEAKATLSQIWEEEATTKVPVSEDLRLNENHAKHLESATVLYADLDGSTNMVDTYSWSFAAEIYKIYLRSAAQIIRSEGGSITAYDGDRIMAIFIGDNKNTSAVKAALQINYTVNEILRPAIKNQYPNTSFILKHVIGVDTSNLRAARIGVKGDNDIVWVGQAANYAAKLCTLSEKPLWITKAVFEMINKMVKFADETESGTPMWEKRFWTPMNNFEIYCSTYQRNFG